MSESIQVKICGITRREDAELASALGADFLGFIFYPKSPRSLELAEYRHLDAGLPAIKRVYVQVRPDVEELAKAAKERFDFFQLHFAAGDDPRMIEAWAETVSPEKLWLAPRIGPEEEFPEKILDFAETFLIDTYRKGNFGGTGETGDWVRFRQWAERWPNKRWVLAGGLNPGNIARAAAECGASVVDVSSGIEATPGIKSPERMKALFAAVKGR